jgi:hypothetical protein
MLATDAEVISPQLLWRIFNIYRDTDLAAGVDAPIKRADLFGGIGGKGELDLKGRWILRRC